jgi:Zn-dependent protease
MAPAGRTDFHPYLPVIAAQWVGLNLKNALIINVILAVFNLFPLLPLDGGRIAVGLLPNVLANPFSRLEPYGMVILIGLLIILPMLGSQFGVDLGFCVALYLKRNGHCYQSHPPIDGKHVDAPEGQVRL